MDRLFAESSKVVVLGRYWVGVLAAWLPATQQKIVILPNATPRATGKSEPARDGRLRITFLGELGRRKGTPQLMEALARLAVRRDLTATVAGNGAVAEVRASADRLGLADRVEIPGWLDAEQPPPCCSGAMFVRSADLHREFPMTILEAFAHGVPVVTTPVAAITEVVEHERNGLLVPVGDIEALTAALIDFSMRGTPAASWPGSPGRSRPPIQY